MLERVNKVSFNHSPAYKSLRKVILFEGDDLMISREEEFTPEIIRFLEDTTWGTKDTLYEHRNTDERLAQLRDPVLATIRMGGELGSMVVIERRKVTVGDQEIKGYFFRYLANKLPFRQRRLFAVYSIKFMQLIVGSEEDEAIFYASVETKNHRSFNFLSRLGYRHQASVATLAYSRFFPRNDARMSRIQLSEKDFVTKELEHYYRNHSLVHFSYIFQDENYFLLKENGEIIAGCQVHPATWVVKNIPGKLGGFFLKCVPYIPLVRTIFNPNKFDFLTFEGIFVKKGREKELIKLFESVMHHFSQRVSLIWLDERDPLYDRLKDIGRHGMMKNFVENASVRILAIPEKASEQTLDHIKSHPIYVSSFDFI